jgi:uncharacterized caspase-like protein
LKILRVSVSILAASALLGLSVWAGAQSADAPAAPSTQNPRIALVIGEASYPDQTLATSANDAGLVAQVLQAAGFDVVGARDLDEKSIRTALRDFLTRADAAGPNMQAFIYLAGRAVQYEGDNYFVPVDAQIARGADIPIEAVRLADFTHALASAPGLARIIVLDGARANPYAKAGAPLAGGLALVDPEPGELVAFNASPGSIAADEPGPYGSYAKTLAGSMRQGGLPIDDVFAQTRLAVNEASGGAQLPWSASKLTAPYYIFERAADAPPPAAQSALAEASRRPIKSFSKNDAYAAAVQRDTLRGYQDFLAAYPDSAQARRVRAILAGRREALFWRRSVEENSPHAYWTYLRRYPRGPHAGEADERLTRLSAREEPPHDFEPEVYSDLPPPPRDELVYADRPYYVFVGPDYGPPPPPPSYVYEDEDDGWRDLPPPPPPTIFGVLPALAVAVPLLLTARAYHDVGHRDGHAEPGAPPPRPVPSAPPPLPPRRSCRTSSARSNASETPADAYPLRGRHAGSASQDAVATDALADAGPRRGAQAPIFRAHSARENSATGVRIDARPERATQAGSEERGRACAAGEDAAADAYAERATQTGSQERSRAASAGDDATADAERAAQTGSEERGRGGAAGEDAAADADAERATQAGSEERGRGGAAGEDAAAAAGRQARAPRRGSCPDRAQRTAAPAGSGRAQRPTAAARPSGGKADLRQTAVAGMPEIAWRSDQGPRPYFSSPGYSRFTVFTVETCIFTNKNCVAVLRLDRVSLPAERMRAEKARRAPARRWRGGCRAASNAIAKRTPTARPLGVSAASCIA